MIGNWKKKLTLALSIVILGSQAASATVVEVQTVLGNFQVNLFDKKTPATVTNFLGYVNSGAYYSNVVHRSVPDFVIQAGGFTYNDEFPLDQVTKGAAIVNEPELSNVRGTIAMAKSAGDPDSATSEWFINLDDNSANLDIQNGGFSVFGQVLGDGMEVVDAIAAVQTYNAGGALTDIPLRDYSDDQEELKGENLILITDIVVVDDSTDTHPELEPVPNTLIDEQQNDNDSGSSGSGGGLSWGALMLCIAAILRVRPSIRYCRH
jgi:peptidyl-prolyl cis-trans isomerase A (cyclophilin A)